MKTNSWSCALFSVTVMLVGGCGNQPKPHEAVTPIKDSGQGSKVLCDRAAMQVLGSQAEVLRCGTISGSGVLEALAVLRLSHPRRDNKGVFVSRLVIIRQHSSQWTRELDIGKDFLNPQGYIATDFIDDSAVPSGYRIRIADQRTDGVPAFDLWIEDLSENGYPEGAGTEIAWNPSVGRFQEFAYYEDPPRFRSEIKNPPRSKKK